MTLREKAEVLFLRAQGVQSRADAELLWAEAREINRRLRGGHNSVGHRPSVIRLRRQLGEVTSMLRHMKFPSSPESHRLTDDRVQKL